MADVVKVYIITKALYVSKSSGVEFWEFLAEILDEMCFKSSIADTDVCLRPAVNLYGKQYYKYVLVYVYEILGIIIDANKVLLEKADSFQFKKNKI